MLNKYINKIHKLLTKNKLIVIIIIIIGVSGALYSFLPNNNLTYEEQKTLMEESAKISAQIAINTNINNELQAKTGYNLSEIQLIAKKFKEKAKNSYDEGLAYFNLGEYNAAINNLNNSLGKVNNGFQEFYIGTAYLKLNDFEPAKIWFKKCQDNFQCLNQLSSLYAAENDFVNSIKYQKDSLSILPNPGGFYNLGTIYAMQKNNKSYEKAIYYFDESLKFNDKSWEIITQNSQQIYNEKKISKQSALLNKGYCLMNLNRLNESLTIFKEIEKKGRNDFRINYNLAINYFRLNDYNNAKFYITQTLNINPNDEEAQLLQKILFQS